MVSKAKGEGSKGGSIIGHTRSGKPIYGPDHKKFNGVHKTYGEKEPGLKRELSVAKKMHTALPDYTREDHQDAAEMHEAFYGKSNQMAQHSISQSNWHPEHPGVDRQKAGQAADVHMNDMESHGKMRRAHESAATFMGRKTDPSWGYKSDTPDFAKGLFDITNMMQEQLALQNAEVEMATFPQRVDVLSPGGDGGVPTKVEQVGLTPPGAEQNTLTFRVDILAPTPLSTQETLMMAKSIKELPAIDQQTELVRCGLNVVGPRKVSFAKSTLSLVEFADAVGTTEDTVRRLAKRCGDPQHFVAMIRDKMPDIQRAHSLSNSDAEQLYATASRTLKSLTPQQWGQWCSKSFAGQQVTDQGLADAIRMNGIMHRNQCTSEGFSVMGGPVITEPKQELASPEPITPPVEARPLIGGNLSIGVRSTDVGPYAFRN